MQIITYRKNTKYATNYCLCVDGKTVKPYIFVRKIPGNDCYQLFSNNFSFYDLIVFQGLFFDLAEAKQTLAEIYAEWQN